MPNNHLIDALMAAALVTPGRQFISERRRDTLTFAEFFSGACRMASVLAASDLRPGDRVAAQTEKSVEALQFYIGTIMAGGVYLPLNPAYTTEEVGYFLTDASPKVLVCDPKQKSKIVESGAANGVDHVFTMDHDGSGSLARAAAPQSGEFTPVHREPEDLAAILYTSGTTGRAKGAMLSHRALVSNSTTLQNIWGFSDQDTLIHALPIYHTHGLFVATNVALISGASLRFLTKFDAQNIIDDMPTCTALMGVPTFYTRLLATAGLTKEAAQNMRLFISGSAPLLSKTHREWEARTGHRILERYGMTETNMNTSNPLVGMRKPGTVGLPLPDVELRICDPASGNQLPQGDVGMIEVRGPNVFSGYWKMPEKTAEDLRPNGFLITGDQGVIDVDGYVSIVGRSKDMIISGGLNIYPKEVEAVLDQIEGVKESAVIGVPHADFGEAVFSLVVTDGGKVPRASQIDGFLASKLARFKLPKRVEFVDQLPRNAMGKVQKNILRETFADVFAN